MEKRRKERFESSCYKTPQFAKFAKETKKELVALLEKNDLELVAYNVGHFYISGFARNNEGKVGYFSISDVRSRIIRYDRVLYRTAKNEKDYCGGTNHFAPFPEIASSLANLLKKGS